MYHKINITKFEGLNAEVSPELIGDGAARDILNLRMEKVGKLVSRNGYVYGMFNQWNTIANPTVSSAASATIPSTYSDDVDGTTYRQMNAYIYNLGIIGIGEITLSEKWDDMDTDKFMVYYIRGMAERADDTQTYKDAYGINKTEPSLFHGDVNTETEYRFRGMYLLSPITGRYSNVLLLDTDDQGIGYVADKRDSLPQGKNETMTNLKVANRYLPAYMNDIWKIDPQPLGTSNFKYNHWIDYYVQMRQYRRALIISDRVNGDLLIEDEYDRSKEQGYEPPHELHIRPNTLAKFDIDVVDLDTMEDADLENDQTSGVESGMALYNYQLPEKQSKVSIDHYDKVISNPDYWIIDDDNPASSGAMGKRDTKNTNVNKYMSYNNPSTLLTFKQHYNFYADIVNIVDDYKYKLNKSNRYVFTNTDTIDKIQDILGELEFPKQKYKDEKGITQEEVSADVIIWNDLKFNYYLSHGKNEAGYKLLTDNDKDFNSIQLGTPRITDIEEIPDAGKNAPLGVWRYRYVWDYGNGIYSSPSSELLAPDLLWSAVTDDMIKGSSTVYSPLGLEGDYQRHKKITGLSGVDSFLGQYTTANERIITGTTLSDYGNREQSHTIKSPNMWYEDGSGIIKLTDFGNMFYKIKAELYTGRRFGVLDTSNLETAYNDFDGILQRGEFSTLITVYFKNSNEETKGYIWEGSFINTSADVHEGLTKDLGDDVWCFYGMGKLVVPIFKTLNKPVTYNSLFDDYGRYRLAYINNLKPSKQIVSPGYNSGIGGVYFSSYGLDILVAASGANLPHNEGSDPNLYANIVPLQYEDALRHGDYNNSDTATATGTLLKYLRSNTILRAVNNDSDRLLNVNPKADIDAVNRLVLQGIAEIPVIGYGDEVSMQPEKVYTDPQIHSDSPYPSYQETRLGYDDKREGIIAIREEDYTDPYFDKAQDNDGVYIGDGYQTGHQTNPGVSARYRDINNELYAISQMSMSGSWIWDDTIRNKDTFNAYDNPHGGSWYPTDTEFKTGEWVQFRTITITLASTIHDAVLARLKQMKEKGTKLYVYNKQPSNGMPNGDYTIIDIMDYGSYIKIVVKENPQPLSEIGDYHIQPTAYKTLELKFYSPADADNLIYDNNMHNLEVYVYGEADRFIGIEQLTSYFPSSLMFKAPRLGIKIKNENVPARAKQLLIFRTKASHNNDYSPNNYGLVKEVKIKRDDNDKAISNLKDGTVYDGVYFFDDIKDENLDFGAQPDMYEGFEAAFKSRFNVAVNERAYYANFIETYQPKKPRNHEPLTIDHTIANTSYDIVDAQEGYGKTVSLSYKYVYKDVAGVLTEAGEIENVYIDVPPATFGLKAVVLYYMPKGYDDSIKSLEIYRSTAAGKYYLIGEMTKDSLGIFVDTNLEDGKELISLEPNIENYESGIRWSELYRPDWIKANSFVEAKSGDGDQITGLEVMYGNLIVFKETSIHRYAVQGGDIPISRTDEVSGQIGCIAPNTLINVNNTLYFLSWEGFMKYDNNVLQKFDIKFDEELQFVMQTIAHTTVTDVIGDIHIKSEAIRDASAGFNTAYNEIYLNIPMLPTLHHDTDIDDGKQLEVGHAAMYQESPENGENATSFDRPVTGHIYIINLDKGYNTKYAYPVASKDPRNTAYLRDIIDPSQLIRLYHTNTLGEFRSADIMPIRYNVTDANLTGDIIRSGIYIESPYKIGSTTIFKDTDDILDASNLSSNLLASKFPTDYILQIPIKSIFKSKYFTGDAETLIKRLREIGLNIFSRGNISLVCKVFPFETENQLYADERIDDQLGTYTQANQILALINEMFDFNPSITSIHPISGITSKGTGTNILHAIPRSIASDTIGGIRSKDSEGSSGTGALIVSDKYNDWYGKPIRVSLEITAELRTQLNGITLNWRPIHTYLV